MAHARAAMKWWHASSVIHCTDWLRCYALENQTEGSSNHPPGFLFVLRGPAPFQAFSVASLRNKILRICETCHFAVQVQFWAASSATHTHFFFFKKKGHLAFVRNPADSQRFQQRRGRLWQQLHLAAQGWLALTTSRLSLLQRAPVSLSHCQSVGVSLHPMRPRPIQRLFCANARTDRGREEGFFLHLSSRLGLDCRCLWVSSSSWDFFFSCQAE